MATPELTLVAKNDKNKQIRSCSTFWHDQTDANFDIYSSDQLKMGSLIFNFLDPLGHTLNVVYIC